MRKLIEAIHLAEAEEMDVVVARIVDDIIGMYGADWTEREVFQEVSDALHRGAEVDPLKTFNAVCKELYNKQKKAVEPAEPKVPAGDNNAEAGVGAEDKPDYSNEAVCTAMFNALSEEHVGFDAMVSKLKSKGHSEESAKKIAASIGRKKYGAKEMAAKAAAAKKE